MKNELIDSPPSGHIYTATEVKARLEQGMKAAGFSGVSGYSGMSCDIRTSQPERWPRAKGNLTRESLLVISKNRRDSIHDVPIVSHNESFIAKNIRELKEYFQALFVKTHHKKEIEHGK